ncbi:MAG: hypothetical protein L0G81_00180 [Ewingella sp.]|uniref:hypothetical protein n=1 Tax=Ewingella TaxID=41201 RepID=UPI00181B7F0E|nr:hypothetical protein [Ewingella sp.]NWA36416.1 hypothetical protein [Pseudomonas reactans]
MSATDALMICQFARGADGEKPRSTGDAGEFLSAGGNIAAPLYYAGRECGPIRVFLAVIFDFFALDDFSFIQQPNEYPSLPVLGRC